MSLLVSLPGRSFVWSAIGGILVCCSGIHHPDRRAREGDTITCDELRTGKVTLVGRSGDVPAELQPLGERGCLLRLGGANGGPVLLLEAMEIEETPYAGIRLMTTDPVSGERGFAVLACGSGSPALTFHDIKDRNIDLGSHRNHPDAALRFQGPDGEEARWPK